MSDAKKKMFQDSTKKDETLQNLIQNYKKGWPLKKEKLSDDMKHFWNLKDRIYEEDNLVFFDHRVMVPKDLIQEMLNILHESHMGITRTTNRAKEVMYWRHMDDDIQNFISKCRICERFKPQNKKHSLKPHTIPTLPFQKIGIDFLDFQGRSYLVAIDYYSKWIELFHARDKTANSVMTILNKIFSIHGIPKIIISDNQPFNSFALKNFATLMNFDFIYSSPRFPQSNGLAEKAVHIAKNMLKKANNGNIDLALLDYRSTPIPGLGLSPAEMLMSRKLRTKLPIHERKLKQVTPCNVPKLLKEKQKRMISVSCPRKELDLRKGDNVVYRHNNKWEPGRVLGQHDTPRSYWLRNEDNNIIRRNTTHLRKSLNSPQIRLPCDYNLNEKSSLPCNTENITLNTQHPIQQENNLQENLCRQENQELNHSTYTTRYGRSVRRPDFFRPS